ncbi:hypothetical protein D3C77_503490 [compost metagenome]
MDTNKMREQFEAAYLAEMARLYGNSVLDTAAANLGWVREDGSYGDPMLRLARWAWQASREAVAVDVGDMEWVHIDEIIASIEAQGLKVAP